MTLNCESLLDQLAALAADVSSPQRYIVAFSGGLDSSVLLHALAAGAAQHGVTLLAVHVNHGLQDEAEIWMQHCETVAAAMGVEFLGKQVKIDNASAQGPEAAARDARYRALASVMRSGDWLLSAHHQDDQAETMLLNLLRGGGPAGLAGIADIKPFAAGWLARPLLPFSRTALQAYADLHELSWVDDPSNDDRRFDRNFLRHEILPRLEARWPEAAKCLQRSSRLANDAAVLLDDLAAIDLATLGDRNDRLGIDVLSALSSARQRNVLRCAIRQMGLPTPSAAHLQQVLNTLLSAREDAEPVVRWNGIEIRRYRKQLYILAAGLQAAPAGCGSVAARDRLELAHGLGVLRLETGAAEGLSEDLVERGLELRYRHGGEKFRPIGQSHTRKLKKLLQEAGIVPWMRDRIPLLYSGGELVAVADLWLAADAASQPGTAVHWENRPPIH